MREFIYFILKSEYDKYINLPKKKENFFHYRKN